ncbi:MAG: hypothetical protein NUW37_07950 [Planctomycetes bacterium]|nr:hypothetical protein [Planctomycetota bacterium]
MNPEEYNLDGMTAEEKFKLMGELLRAIASTPGNAKSPKWNLEVVKERKRISNQAKRR